VEEILKLVTDKSGLGADKLRAVVQTVLGFLRSKVPASAQSQFDAAVGTQGADLTPAEPRDIMKEAEKAGLSAGQVKSVIDTVLGFLKSKLPADVYSQISGQVTSLMSGAGSAGGLFQKVASLFTGKS
jgi:hypothetical protein